MAEEKKAPNLLARLFQKIGRQKIGNREIRTWIGLFLLNSSYSRLGIALLMIAVILLSLLLAGCSTSSPIANIYLISLSYQAIQSPDPNLQVNPALAAIFADAVGNASLEVRVGYFALCIREAGSQWQCRSNSTGLVDSLQPRQDPLNLISEAHRFKDGVVFDGLVITVIVLTILSAGLFFTFPNWHDEIDDAGSDTDVKPFPSRYVTIALALFMSAAALLGLVALLWQHAASSATASAVQSMAYGTVRGQVGTVAAVLGWLAIGCLFLAALGIIVMILSIVFLDKLTGD